PNWAMYRFHWSVTIAFLTNSIFQKHLLHRSIASSFPICALPMNIFHWPVKRKGAGLPKMRRHISWQNFIFNVNRPRTMPNTAWPMVQSIRLIPTLILAYYIKGKVVMILILRSIMPIRLSAQGSVWRQTIGIFLLLQGVIGATSPIRKSFYRLPMETT